MYRVPGLLAYGMSKIALEHLTVHAAEELAECGVAANCFRIDIGVASEGLLANYGIRRPRSRTSGGGGRRSRCDAEQPVSYSGHLVSMRELRDKAGILVSAQGVVGPVPGAPMFQGLERARDAAPFPGLGGSNPFNTVPDRFHGS